VEKFAVVPCLDLVTDPKLAGENSLCLHDAPPAVVSP
jgi:hypothetical protein